jgi:hypothetical protein
MLHSIRITVRRNVYISTSVFGYMVDEPLMTYPIGSLVSSEKFIRFIWMLKLASKSCEEASMVLLSTSWMTELAPTAILEFLTTTTICRTRP